MIPLKKKHQQALGSGDPQVGSRKKRKTVQGVRRKTTAGLDPEKKKEKHRKGAESRAAAEASWNTVMEGFIQIFRSGIWLTSYMHPEGQAAGLEAMVGDLKLDNFIAQTLGNLRVLHPDAERVQDVWIHAL